MQTQTIETQKNQNNRTEARLRYLTEAFSRMDLKELSECYSQDAVVSDPQYSEPLRGRQAIEKDFSEFFKAFPDLKMEVRQVLIQENVFGFDFTMSGTHQGNLLGPSGSIPATHKKISIGGAIFSRLDSQGLIKEEHRHYDLAGLLGQLGVLQ